MTDTVLIEEKLKFSKLHSFLEAVEKSQFPCFIWILEVTSLSCSEASPRLTVSEDELRLSFMLSL